MSITLRSAYPVISRLRVGRDLPVLASVSVPASWLIFGMSILVVWTVCGAVAFRMESGGYTALDEEAADWLKSRQQTADGKTADRKKEDDAR